MQHYAYTKSIELIAALQSDRPPGRPRRDAMSDEPASDLRRACPREASSRARTSASTIRRRLSKDQARRRTEQLDENGNGKVFDRRASRRGPRTASPTSPSTTSTTRRAPT